MFHEEMLTNGRDVADDVVCGEDFLNELLEPLLPKSFSETFSINRTLQVILVLVP